MSRPVPALTSDRQKFLEDIDRWNDYARRMNQRAIEDGVVDAETVRRNRDRTEAARAELLRRWEQTQQAQATRDAIPTYWSETLQRRVTVPTA